jgi:hypothetical protein
MDRPGLRNSPLSISSSLKKASEAAVASAARSSSSLKTNKRKISRRFTPRNDEPKEFFNDLLEVVS